MFRRCPPAHRHHPRFPVISQQTMDLLQEILDVEDEDTDDKIASLADELVKVPPFTELLKDCKRLVVLGSILKIHKVFPGYPHSGYDDCGEVWKLEHGRSYAAEVPRRRRSLRNISHVVFFRTPHTTESSETSKTRHQGFPVISQEDTERINELIRIKEEPETFENMFEDDTTHDRHLQAATILAELVKAQPFAKALEGSKDLEKTRWQVTDFDVVSNKLVNTGHQRYVDDIMHSDLEPDHKYLAIINCQSLGEDNMTYRVWFQTPEIPLEEYEV